MIITTHLCFDGQCREAFETYHRLFGGTLQTMMSYGESPMAGDIEPQWHERIVHATLVLGDVELMGADLMPQDFHKPQGFFVAVTIDDRAQAAEIFESLAEGGEIQLPFQSTFWSPGFGVVVDRFGVPWEINSAEAPAA
jgi:PhnB protein